MVQNLVIAADVLFGLFFLIGLIQSLQRQAKAGCWSALFLTSAALPFIGAVILYALADANTRASLSVLILASAGAWIILSFILWILDRRAGEKFQSAFSRGILGIGVGLFGLASFFFVPVLPQAVFVIPTPTGIAESVLVRSTNGSGVIPVIVPTTVAQSSSAPEVIQPTFTPTITTTPLPQPTMTRTLRAYIPPTITTTPDAPAVSDDCTALVNQNLNVRQNPTTDADVVAIIPEGRYIQLLARNLETTWWLTEFEGEQGWVVGEFLTIAPICYNER
jgi:hypothetical protein